MRSRPEDGSWVKRLGRRSAPEKRGKIPVDGGPLKNWIPEARKVLIKAARADSVVRFRDFVDRVEGGSGVPGAGYAVWMHTTLRDLAELCLKRGEPILSALCVNRDGTVAGGYAEAIEKHGHNDVEQHAALERQKCYLYYKLHPNHSVNRSGSKPVPRHKKLPAQNKLCPAFLKSVTVDRQDLLSSHFKKGGVPCPGGRPPAQPRTHPCRICGADVPVNRKGALRLHNAEGRNGVVPCPAAGMIVAPGKLNRGKKGIDPVSRALPASRSAATTGRLNDTAKSNANGVRKIIGGGSPGLGKNNK